MHTHTHSGKQSSQPPTIRIIELFLCVNWTQLFVKENIAAYFMWRDKAENNKLFISFTQNPLFLCFFLLFFRI